MVFNKHNYNRKKIITNILWLVYFMIFIEKLKFTEKKKVEMR